MLVIETAILYKHYTFTLQQVVDFNGGPLNDVEVIMSLKALIQVSRVDELKLMSSPLTALQVKHCVTCKTIRANVSGLVHLNQKHYEGK